MRRFGALSNDENNESKQKESSQKNINPYHSTPPTIIVAIIYNPIVNINPRKNISTLNELDRNWPITKAAKVIFAIPYNAEDKPLHWVEFNFIIGFNIPHLFIKSQGLPPNATKRL
jgi:hypothetical protein